MNRIEREALAEKVRRSDNPYRELFGTDQIGRSGQRKRLVSEIEIPGREVLPDSTSRVRFQMRIMQRTLQIMKHLDPDLYADLYRAEMKVAVAKLVDQKAQAPDQDLVRKYNRRLTPAKGSGTDG